MKTIIFAKFYRTAVKKELAISLGKDIYIYGFENDRKLAESEIHSDRSSTSKKKITLTKNLDINV